MNQEHQSPHARQGIKEQHEQQQESGKQKRKGGNDRLTVRSGKNYSHSSKLSPLPKRQQGKHEEHEQQEHPENPKTQRGQEGSDSISPRGSKSYFAKEHPSTSRDNKSENVLHPVRPLVPSVESKLTANSYTQAEIPFSSSNGDNNSNLLLSRFAPLTERSVSSEVAATSNADEFYGKNKEEFDTSTVFGEFLTDDMLREWTGWEDLHLVLTAEMHLDAVRTLGVDTISERMPLLHSLRLNNSRIPQIRLLGTKFMNLKRLWIRGSRIGCLRGIGACAPLLEELYASFNSVRDITPLLDLSDTLEVVDFEGNEIHDSNMLLRCLPLLRKVKFLTLQGNPVEISYYNSQEESSNATEKSFSASTSFREFVRSLMPDLQYLNDIPFDENNSRAQSSASKAILIQPNSPDNHAEQHKEDSSLLETTTTADINHVDPLNVSLCDEYMFLQQCIRECGFDALDAAVEDETRPLYTRPQTSCAGARPRLSSLTSQLNSNSRSCNSANAAGRRPITNNDTRIPLSSTFPPHASNASSGTSTTVASPCTSSLTVGRPMVGGGAVSLRRRLPPLHPTPLAHTASTTDSSSSKSFYSAQSGGDGISGEPEAGDVHFTPTSTPLRGNHLALDTPLFEEEEEWEVYKQSLLRRGEAQRTGSSSNAQRWIKYVGSESVNSSHGEPENGGLSGLSYSTSARTTSASSDPSARCNNNNNNDNHNHTVNGGQVTPLPSQSLSSTNMTVLLPTPRAAIAVADSVESCAASVEVSPDGKSSEVRGTEEKRKREKEKVNEDEIREEEAWRQELLRSVARSRTRTARAGMSGKSLRLGDVSNNDMEDLIY
ncbi:hypothetical protein LSM04_005918 [Trypanosoma melophagium]|uniref:uncharacterized protein n=1 Tax=Trypanosoma melophagium TaxID=715481 RepID=UPI00351A3566|nr:hypothetical protein LSM04_005918 [Trypanosoma melophagium]